MADEREGPEQPPLSELVRLLRADVRNRPGQREVEQARRIGETLRGRAAAGDEAAARELEKYAPLPFEEAQAIVLTAWHTDPRRTGERFGVEPDEPAGDERPRARPEPPPNRPHGGPTRRGGQPGRRRPPGPPHGGRESQNT